MLRRRTTREQLARTYAALGVDDEAANDAVGSEIDENLPQLAYAALSWEVWRSVDAWRDDVGWIARLADGVTGANDPAARDALRRALASGVPVAELAAIARYVAASQAFSTLATLDDTRATQVEETTGVRLPGWQVRELDARGRPTGRDLTGGMHESFFGWGDTPPRTAR